LAERIFDAGQCRSVLIGKEWDLNYVEEIMRLDKRNVIHNLTAQTNIMQALALIRAANVFIGFPSGLTILATKFKTPVVMFWSIKNITPNGKFKKEFQTCWVDKRVLDAGTYFPFAYGAPETNYKFVFDKIRRFIV
jgi:ADP-heptose:LPS heptosyltransferase